MFEPDSRYATIPVATYVTRDGREIKYVRRRFLPRAEGVRALAIVTVNEGDRLDLVSARSLGDPLAYWRICDGNDAMDPPDLVAEPGRSLVVPSPI